MRIKSICFSFISFLFLVFIPNNSVSGQVKSNSQDFDKSTDYEIGEIKVTGINYSDEQAIISVTGLRVGNNIKIPGSDIPHAIKALWKLRLFTNIEIFETKKIGTVVFLEIKLKELPRFSGHSFKGIRKQHHDDLSLIVNKHLVKGGIVTENIRTNVCKELESFFIHKGFLDTKVTAIEMKDFNAQNGVRIEFTFNKKKRVKIQDITFTGNNKVSSKKLRSEMKKTKRRRHLFSSSKFIAENYKTDKENIISYYNKNGYRDARILSDSTWRNEKGGLMLNFKIEEGNKYYFGDITWKGNSIYATKTLVDVLGIKKGDVFNAELLDTRLSFSQDGRDISTLYMDNGYLFFRINPVEIGINKDSIDLQIQIFEGPQAVVDKVIITGNDLTNEDVIRRELHTQPGEKFSRTNIIRSQREIVNLGFFNPETLGIKTPVDPKKGTVDIEYEVEEKPSDRLELSGNWGGADQGLIGTVGISFNNFSVRNMLKRETWNPLPTGDGQRLSLRAQSNGKQFQSYNISFTEPWLGGKKPKALTVGGYHTRVARGERETTTFEQVGITGLTLGLGTRLNFPDNYFVSNTTLSLQNIKLNNWNRGDFVAEDGTIVTNGKFKNFSIKQTIARSTIDNPIFPTSGSNFSLSGQFTLPYSLFKGNSGNELATSNESRWAEYHKWRFTGQWYTPLVGKLILKAQVKVGLLGRYSKKARLSPFEKFVVGGDGFSNQSSGILGYDVISLRGYDVEDLSASTNGGAAAFNKFTVELRYPFMQRSNTTMYALAFAEGGNSWNSIKDYNPFDMKRSAGLGLRVHLPMFGTLGFDYGIGFDKPALNLGNAKWNQFGKFSIILGLEPE